MLFSAFLFEKPLDHPSLGLNVHPRASLLNVEGCPYALVMTSYSELASGFPVTVSMIAEQFLFKPAHVPTLAAPCFRMSKRRVISGLRAYWRIMER